MNRTFKVLGLLFIFVITVFLFSCNENDTMEEIEGIEFKDKTFVYDGLSKNIYIDGKLPENIIVSYLNNSKVDAGNYTVIAQFTDSNNKRRKFNELEAVLTIKPNEIEVSFDGQEFIYDGEEKRVEITGNLPTGVTVEYFNNNQINAGTYEVEAKFNNDNPNYKPLEDLTAILTIEPKELEVFFDDQEFTYDGEEKEVKIRGNLPTGVIVEYVNNKQTNVGVYEIKAQFKDSNNISGNFKELKAILIIKLPPPNINETIEELSLNRTITWDSVEGATSYKVVIDGEEITLDKNTLEYNFSDYIGYDIKIYAVGDNAHINSEQRQLIFTTTENNINYLYFGKYQQTVVDDESLIGELNKLTQTNESGYYVYEGNEYAKLLANPYTLVFKFSNGETIVSEKIYYFKVEPIKWRILEQEDGTLTLLTDMILDQQQFYSSTSTRTKDGGTIYPNNYEHSTIREWLNNDFYNKAFNNLNKEIILTSFVDNSASTTNNSINEYTRDDTNDKIYLLSYQEARYTYFKNDSERQAIVSDYVKARYVYADFDYNTGNWWLRSPSSYGSDYAYFVGTVGYLSYNDVDYDFYGARPALKIKID